jgi:hypothetical protein
MCCTDGSGNEEDDYEEDEDADEVVRKQSKVSTL